MPKRVLIVVVAAAVILATNLAGVADSGGFRGDGYRHHPKNIPIDWKVAGTLVYLQLAPLPNPDPEISVPGIMIQADLKGAPGKAHFTVISIGNGPTTSGECGFLGQKAKDNDMVITFEDLSMIFARLINGYVCIHDDFITVDAHADMEIYGGRGKYEGAGGCLHGNFDGVSVGTSGALSAETGTIEGEIVWESSVPQ